MLVVASVFHLRSCRDIHYKSDIAKCQEDRFLQKVEVLLFIYVFVVGHEVASSSTYLLQRFNDNSRSTTTTVADAGAADLALLLPQDAEEGCCYPGTRSTKSVAESNGTSVKVNLILVDSKNLHVGKRDNAESLVDLESVDRR